MEFVLAIQPAVRSSYSHSYRGLQHGNMPKTSRRWEATSNQAGSSSCPYVVITTHICTERLKQKNQRNNCSVQLGLARTQVSLGVSQDSMNEFVLGLQSSYTQWSIKDIRSVAILSVNGKNIQVASRSWLLHFCGNQRSARMFSRNGMWFLRFGITGGKKRLKVLGIS